MPIDKEVLPLNEKLKRTRGLLQRYGGLGNIYIIIHRFIVIQSARACQIKVVCTTPGFRNSRLDLGHDAIATLHPDTEQYCGTSCMTYSIKHTSLDWGEDSGFVVSFRLEYILCSFFFSVGYLDS